MVKVWLVFGVVGLVYHKFIVQHHIVGIHIRTLPTAAQHLKKAAMKSGRYVFLCGHFYGVKIRFSPFPPLGNRAKNKEAKPKSFKLLLLASEARR
jgi:hypothetical protein